MTELLSNFISGQWQAGQGAGTALHDPVLGTELVRVDATGLDLPAAFAFARQQGGSALRALTYRQRAALLSAAAERPRAEGRGTTSVPLARSLGGGIGIALAGAITVGIVGRTQLDQAEHADGAVPMIADAVQHADVLLAVLCLLSLPLVMLLRRDSGR